VIGSAQGRRPRRLCVSIALAALLAASVAASAHGAVTAAVAQRPGDVRDYWTAQRMAAAVPLAGPAAPDLGGPAPAETAATPSYARPAAPGSTAAARLRSGVVGSAAAQRAAMDVSADSSGFPRRVHGKVFLTLGDTDYVCSATVVDSAAHTVVWTAGHCVNGSDIGLGFASNWMFVPGYIQGQAPYGSWSATTLMTTDGWQSGSNLRLDVGAAILARDYEGRGIQDVVGGRGIAFDQPRNQSFDVYGYPAVDPNTALLPPNFDGERLFRCGSGRIANDRPPGSGPETMEIDCDMTAGASGGGWVIGDEFLNSVISYGYEFDSNHLFGPYFGQTVKRLYKQASGPPLLCAGHAVTNLGGPGADDFSGTEASDSFSLARGPDQAHGLAASDFACGGGGDDGLRGGGGTDRLHGQGGDDLLIGGPGRDVCDGGPGHDAARGCEVRRHIP
jgi:hypothetical protein